MHFLNQCSMGNANQKTWICSVLLSLPPLDLATVMSILAALMLWSSSVDPPAAGPSMCMSNQVTPLTPLLPSPGWLQQNTARVEGMYFGDGQQAILSWVC